jgi:crossover junction endodeoxyribonuclease RuvC
MHRVLGIDPGVSETGWAILEAAPPSPAKLLASGLIKTHPTTEFPERLRLIHQALTAILAEHAPDSVAIEEMFFMKAANTVRMTLQARGVALLAAAQADKEVREYNPRSVKLALTGSGTAEKAHMQTAVMKALGLAQRLHPDDVADAAAIGLCHLRSLRVTRLKVLDRFGGKRLPR